MRRRVEFASGEKTGAAWNERDSGTWNFMYAGNQRLFFFQFFFFVHMLGSDPSALHCCPVK